MFAKFGISAVIAAKFVPGVGFLIPALAGTLRISFGKFLGFDVLGSLLYGAFYMTLGFLFSKEVNGALESLSKIGLGAVGLVLLIFVVFVARKYAQQRKAVGAASEAAASTLMTVSETRSGKEEIYAHSDGDDNRNQLDHAFGF